MNNIIPINSEHISYTVISKNNKSSVKLTVAENAVPKNTDKIHISVVYTVNSSQPEEQNVLASIDYRTSPITVPGMETNEFGIAIAGSKIPTASDFE